MNRDLAPALLALIWVAAAFGQDAAVPADVQWAMIPKVLAFDRSLPRRAADGLVLGILYQERYRTSLEAVSALTAEITRSDSVMEWKVQLAPVNLSLPGDLDSSLAAQGVDILYVAPLRAFDLGELAEITRRRGILTVTAVPEYVEAGLAVGLELRGRFAQIVINRTAAQQEGSDFSSRVLKLARVIQ